MENAERKLMQNLFACTLHLSFQIVDGQDGLYTYLQTLYKQIFSPASPRTVPLVRFMGTLQPQTVYGISDRFCLYSVAVRLPHDTRFVLLGPCLLEEPNRAFILRVLRKNDLPPDQLEAFQAFYLRFPVLDQARMHTLGRSIGQYLYNNEPLDHRVFNAWEHELVQPEYVDDAARLLEVQSLNDAYAEEKELTDAVAHGRRDKAFELLLKLPTPESRWQECADPLRCAKNACLAFHVRVDAAAGQGGVSPFHREQGRRMFAARIENAQTVKEVYGLSQNLLRYYLDLVQQQNLPQGSKLLRQVIEIVQLDLSTPLSVRSIAARLDVSADYLSHSFKKQMGLSLSEYINKQRIIRAVQYLDETDLPIRDIALYVGYEDIAYFSRVFKHYVNRTPRDYRKIVRGTLPTNLSQYFALVPRPGGKMEKPISDTK